MATNFDKFKQILEKRAETATSGSKSRWLKLDKGQTKTIRFLPLKSQNLELPVEIFDHHAIMFPDGKYESFACRKKKGEGDCPFCKLASDMWQKYSATKDEKYKEAFKQLVVKSAYLLVGYDVNAVDPSNITEEDAFIVRVSAKEPVAQIDNFLQKGKDFVDFTVGRNCNLKKPVADKQAITWLWELDSEPAFVGKGGESIWKKLIEVSPDLTSEVASPSDERLAELISRFKASPSESDSNMEAIPEAPFTQNRQPVSVDKTKTVAKDDSDLVDMDALRKALED